MIVNLGSADFAPLGKYEFTGPTAFFEFAESGRRIALAAEDILEHAVSDLFAGLITIPPADPAEALRRFSMNSPQAKARRVVRHLQVAQDSVHTAAISFAKLPRIYRKVYAAEIGGGVRRTRPTWDVNE